MATKQTKVEDEAPKNPVATTPEEARKGEVGKKVTTTFDQRTSVAQPFVRSDGTQDNGLETTDVPGAEAQTSRDSDELTAKVLEDKK